MLNFPEECKVILCNQSAANAVTCDTVSMKNFLKGWFVVIHTGATDVDLTLTLTEATDVASGTNQTLPRNTRIWRDNDVGTTSDVIARVATDATAITIDPATQNGVVAIIEVDPAQLSAGYDCVYLADAGGSAADTCTILFVGIPRVKGQTLATGITD